MSLSIRDASLTTLFRKQRALAAHRALYAAPGFPVGNVVRPEQTNNKTSDVPVNARRGACLLGCNPNATSDPYGFQAPSNVANRNF
jgi:hypothetical protein